MPAFGPLGKGRFRQQGAALLDMFCRAVRIVWQLGSAEAVSFGIMRKCGFPFLCVFKGFAKCEMQVIAVGLRRRPLQRQRHCCTVISAKRNGL